MRCARAGTACARGSAPAPPPVATYWVDGATQSGTGAGMMECKKALEETGGDMEKAIEYFRKKGVKASLGFAEVN